MDARLVLVILLLPLVSGCLATKVLDLDGLPDPGEGDLVLTISMERTTYFVEEMQNRSPNSSIMTITIVLENVCDRSVSVDRSFHIGTSLYPKCYAENGTEIDIQYPLAAREVFYKGFKPGDTMTDQFDPTQYDAVLLINNHQSFDWEVPGRYNIRVSWWGARTSLEVISNTLEFQLV